MNNINRVLFYVFISIFAFTAIITLLGIAGYLKIKDSYLDKLFYSLIVEVVAGIVNLFTIQFLKKPEKIKLMFNVKDIYDINSVSAFKCVIKLKSAEDGKETILPCNLYHDNYGLCSDVEIKNYKQTLFVSLETNNKKYQGSEWLETRTIILKPI